MRIFDGDFTSTLCGRKISRGKNSVDLSFEVFQHLSPNLLFPKEWKKSGIRGRFCNVNDTSGCRRRPDTPKVSGRSSPLPAPLRSNCDHFALRNPPLIGSNYPPTGSRSLRTKAKPTIRLVRKKEKKRRRIVPFETKGERELKIEGKEIGGGGRKRRGPRVGKTMKSLSSLPPVDGEKEDCRIARKASPRSARKNRGTLTRDWEVQPIV